MAQRPHKSVVYGGEFFHIEGNYITHNSTGPSDSDSRKLALKQLVEHIAPGAFHDSEERHDQPKCHPQTRKVIQEVIMNWVKDTSNNSKLLMWLNGPAGAGKSAIMQTIAEICEEAGILNASFFFFRSGPERSIKTHLIATIAYQLSQNVPHFEDHMTAVIIRDPLIFTKKLAVQVKALVVDPFRAATADHRMSVLQKTYLILVDGLDECSPDSAHKEIIILLSTFDSDTYPALDDTYKPDADIRMLLQSTFDDIKTSHPLGRSIPTTWPSDKHIRQLVATASGQFIYAATVLKFIDSPRHNPMRRLDAVLEARLSKEEATSPFAQLDALYHQILASVEDLAKVLDIINCINYLKDQGTPNWTLPNIMEILLGYTNGETQLILCDMHSLLRVPIQENAHNFTHTRARFIQPHHASLRDFLQDPLRCKHLYIKPADVYAKISMRMILSFHKLVQLSDINIETILMALCSVIKEATMTEELAVVLSAFDIYNDKVDACFRHRGFEHQGVTKLLDNWETLYKVVFDKAGTRVYEYFVHRLDIWVARILKRWYFERRQGFREALYHWIILLAAFSRAPIPSVNTLDCHKYVAYGIDWWKPHGIGFFHAILTVTSNPSRHTHKVLTETPGLLKHLTHYHTKFIMRYPPWYLHRTSLPYAESASIVRNLGGISHFRHHVEHSTGHMGGASASFIDVNTGIPNTSADSPHCPSVHMHLFPLDDEHTPHVDMYRDTASKNVFNDQGVAILKGPDLEMYYGLAIINNTDQDLFVYLSYFDPRMDTVANWRFPGNSIDILKKKTVLPIGYGVSERGNPFDFRLDAAERVESRLNDATVEQSSGFIKLFVSTEYVDIDRLARESYTEPDEWLTGERTPIAHHNAYGLLVAEIHFIPN